MDFRPLGEAIRQARLARNWSQETLGRLIYRSQSRVSEIEAGTIPATVEDLVRIGDVLDCHAVDCALAAAVTNGRMGLVAPINGGAPGAMMALEWEMRDLQAAFERVRMDLCRLATDLRPETLMAFRHDIRDVVALAHRMEIECDQLYPMSARLLAREYEESRPHYAAAKQNRPLPRAA